MIIPLYEIVEMETSEQEHFNKFWVVGVPQAVLSTDCEDNLRVSSLEQTNHVSSSITMHAFVKFDFEATFKEYEVQTFQYLKGLGRVLVTCLSREHAELAFERLRTVEFHGMTIHVEPVEVRQSCYVHTVFVVLYYVHCVLHCAFRDYISLSIHTSPKFKQ